MIAEEDVQIVTLIDHKCNSKMHTVRYYLDNNKVECSCKMYEWEGIPCRHILWVFKEKGMKSLPAAYVKTRWTKAAMSMPMFDLGGNLIEDTTKMEVVKKKATCGFFRWVDDVNDIEDMQYQIVEKDTTIADLENEVKMLKEQNETLEELLAEVGIECSERRLMMECEVDDKRKTYALLLSWVFFCNHVLDVLSMKW
ncbi:Protein FAR1-RELATED SEQUENCE 5 [Bienertia sinuspersici]